MQERQVTVGQETHDLPDPFLVIATQNPIEQEGTYPLPEAQLDRFMLNIKVDYPALDEEKRILTTISKDEPCVLTKVLTGKAILNLQKLVAQLAGERLRHRLRDPAGAGDAAQAIRRPPIWFADWWIGARASGGPIPRPGRQGDGGNGRPIQRGHRRHQEGGDPGPAASAQHELPGPGRGEDKRGHYSAPAGNNRGTGSGEISGLSAE